MGRSRPRPRLVAIERNARLYILANAVQALSVGAFAVLYPLFLSALGFSTGFIGALAVLGTLGGAAGILPADRLVRRFGWRAMLLWSNVAGGAALLVQFLAPTAPVFVLTTPALGFSIAVVLVANGPLLASGADAQARTAAFGLNAALNAATAALGSVLGGFLPQWAASAPVRRALAAAGPLLLPAANPRAFQVALLIAGVLAVPSLVPLLLLRDPPGERRVPTPAAPDARMAWRDRLRPLRTLARGPVGRYAAAQGLLYFGAGLYLPYISIYFVRQLQASTSTFGTLAAVLIGLQAVAALVAVPLAARVGQLRGAVLAQFASVPCLLVLSLTPPLALAGAAYLLRGSFMGLTGPLYPAFLMEQTPVEQRIPASGMYNVSWQVSGAVGTGLGGLLIAAGGFRPAMLVAAVCYILSALAMVRWFWRAERVGQAVTPRAPEGAAPHP